MVLGQEACSASIRTVPSVLARMPRFRTNALAVLLLAALAVAQNSPTAVFRGRNAAEWRQRLLRDADQEATRQAGIALYTLSRESEATTRELLPLLQHEQARVRRAAAWFLAHPVAVPALVAAMDDRDGDVRESATRTLGRFGPAAAAATPRLLARIARADGEFDWQLAVDALAAIGPAHPDAIPALLAGVRPGRAGITMRQAFMNLGAAAIPLLQPLLRDQERALAAAEILLDLAANHPVDLDVIAPVVATDTRLRLDLLRLRAERDPAAIPAFVRAFAKEGNPLDDRRGVHMHVDLRAHDGLLELLHDDDAKVLSWSCSLLLEAAVPLPKLVPRLAELLNHDDVNVRNGAAGALGKHGMHAAAACLQPLITAAQSGDATDQPDQFPRLACLALGQLAATHAGAREPLQQLTHQEAEVGAYAALALARHLPDHPDREQWLRRAMASTNAYVGQEVAELRGADAAPVAERALAEATQVLAEPDFEGDAGVRFDALRLLDRIGPHALPAATLVRRHLTHKNLEVQRAALWVVPGLAPKCPDLFDAVFALAKSRDADTLAIEALGAFGAAAQPALPFLQSLLSHHYQDRQRAACHALRDLGALADDVLLAAMVEGDPGGDNTDAAYFATEALVRRGAAAWPVLERAAKDPRPTVRCHAIDALGQIEALHPQARPLLLAALRDEHWVVRGRAVRHLDVLGDTAPDLATFANDADGYVRAAAHTLAEQRRGRRQQR